MLKAVVAIITCTTSLFAQNVTFADPDFKAYLVSAPGINTNGDSEIQVSEAAAYTGDFPSFQTWPNIDDLTGIEAFTSMTVLDCSNHSITSLDVSAMTALTTLRCHNNNLSSLITGNIGITTIQCFNNSLTSLDVLGNTNLMVLRAYDNQLTSINLSANTNLEELSIGNNQLTSLNLSTNSNLVRIDAGDNQLTTLILPSSYTDLEVVGIGNNQLTGDLDFSGCPNFWYLGCNNNLISGINVRNGNNLNFDGFDAIGNPNLTCVEVDDAAWSTATSWWNIDPTAVFSEDCAALASIESIDAKSLSAYPNPASTIVKISGLTVGQSIKVIDITGKVVSKTIVNSSSLALDVTTLENGIYIIQVEQNGVVGVERLVVE